jgi:hypothetical protein
MKKKTLLIGGIATAAVLAGGWAFAQSAGHGPDGTGPGMMQHMARGMGSGMGRGMMRHMDHEMGPGATHRPAVAQFDLARLDTLKAELGITPAQEQAWTNYAKAVRSAATTMKTTRAGVGPDAASKLSPADRFEFVTKMREQARTQFDDVRTASNELLTVLDDGQKAKARDILPDFAEHGPGAMRGAMNGPQHRH